MPRRSEIPSTPLFPEEIPGQRQKLTDLYLARVIDKAEMARRAQETQEEAETVAVYRGVEPVAPQLTEEAVAEMTPRELNGVLRSLLDRVMLDPEPMLPSGPESFVWKTQPDQSFRDAMDVAWRRRAETPMRWSPVATRATSASFSVASLMTRPA